MTVVQNYGLFFFLLCYVRTLREPDFLSKFYIFGLQTAKYVFLYILYKIANPGY